MSCTLRRRIAYPDIERPSLRIGLTLIAALSSSFEIKGGADKGTEIRMHLPLQAGANAELTRILDHPLSEALVSALVGVIAMVAVMVLSIALLGLAGMSGAVARQLGNGSRQTAAAMVVQSRLDSLASLSPCTSIVAEGASKSSASSTQ